MPAHTRTPRAQIAAEFDEFERRLEKKIIRKLAVIGEACINEARNKHTFITRTGNLKSSFGYLIAVDGEIVVEAFHGETDDGRRAAKELAIDALNKYAIGYVLIFVAGMNYASFVANRGYDVIDSAEILAKKITPKIFKKLWND